MPFGQQILALSKGEGMIQNWGMLKEPCKARDRTESQAFIAFLTFVKYYKKKQVFLFLFFENDVS